MSRRLLWLFPLALLVAGACGNDDSSTDVIRAGQLDIKLPPGWKVTESGAVRPPTTKAAAGENPVAGPGTTAPGDTVPLATEDPQTKFFKATGSFQQCLKDTGTKFIGAPDQSNPDSPANDPSYIKNLSTCAAKSNIVQALQEMQSAQDNLTPAEIEDQNKSYLRWRTCMIGRGWGMPKPTPDSKGRLFSFSASSGPQFTPPAGQDLLSSPDLQACASIAQKAAKT